MRVVRLRLHAFRNHEESVIGIGDGPVVVCGPNGAGKTGVLEAIHLLATGRSFRTSDADVLVSTGAVRGVVEADVEVAGGRKVRVGAAVGAADAGRRWMLNGTPRPRHRDVAVLRSVVFAPDDLRLAKGGPSERRDYLDEVLVSVAPRASAIISDYQRVLKQRNVLLRSIRGARGQAVPPALDTWTQMVADKGADLVVERSKVLARLAPHVSEAVAALAGEDASTDYTPAWSPPGDEAVTDLSETDSVRSALATALDARRRDEIDRGTTLVGPHRDDIALGFGGRDVRTHASQGEQRVVSLALRLAHLSVLEDTTDDAPVLLLDDVFSELDPQRRGRLLDRLPRDAQTILTTTASADEAGVPPEIRAALTASGLGGTGGAQLVRVVDGKVLGDAV